MRLVRLRFVAWVFLTGCGAGASTTPSSVTLASPPTTTASTPSPPPLSTPIGIDAFLAAGCRSAGDTRIDCTGARVDGADACQQPMNVVPGRTSPAATLVECFVKPDAHLTGPRARGIRSGGCRMPVVTHVLAATAQGIVELATEDAFRTAFGPVDSPDEAIAFAVVMTGHQAYMNPVAPPPRSHSIVTSPVSTSARRESDGYHVRLFGYQACGCSHPTFAIECVVGLDGTVTVGDRSTLWEDPASAGLCVD